MANESLLITQLPDGTFHVKETEAGGDQDTEPAIDQSVGSPDEAMALVQQWFSDSASEGQDDGAMPEPDAAPSEDPGNEDSGMTAPPTKAAWNAEAKTRDPASGLRK